jgi:ribonuclease HI
MGAVTIYTDASLCPETKAAGWACWMRNEKATHQAGGPFKALMPDSTAAELGAIANALHTCIERGLVPDGGLAVIVTDNMTAKRAIEERWINHPRYGRFVRVAADLMDRNGIKPRMNFVKSHDRTDGHRSSLNNLVDRWARQQMEKARPLALEGKLKRYEDLLLRAASRPRTEPVSDDDVAVSSPAA